MILETPADACAALAVLIAGADDITTPEERRFLFGAMARTRLLDDLTESEVAELLITASQWVFSSFPKSNGRLTDEGQSMLLAMIARAIPKELRGEAVRVAADLARSDGVSTQEVALIRRVCEELEIEPDVERGLLEDGG
jgi:tellurite resistance protein